MTFQQVQKYEYGTNRIGPGRLAKLAKLLDVPVNQFFDGVPNERDEKVGVVTELLANPYAIRMLRALNRISDSETILSVVELAESIADARI